jgi:hypothetical protein
MVTYVYLIFNAEHICGTFTFFVRNHNRITDNSPKMDGGAGVPSTGSGQALPAHFDDW